MLSETGSSIYRTLHPEELYINEEGYLVLTSFEHCKRVDMGDYTYTLLGNDHNYQAPEMILGCGYTFTVDHWALGVLMHELVIGYAPFGSNSRHGDSQLSTYTKIMLHSRGSMQFPPEMELPDTLKDLIDMLLSPEPHERLGGQPPEPGPTHDGAKLAQIHHQNSDGLKDHPFFEGVDFSSITQGTAISPLKHMASLRFKNALKTVEGIDAHNISWPQDKYDGNEDWRGHIWNP